MRRGEGWWADLPPPAGRRPVVLLSRDEAHSIRSLAIVAPVTTRIRHIASEVELGTEDGLPRGCVANLDTITTIPIPRLTAQLTSLTSTKVLAIEAAIHFVLGLTSCEGGRY